MKSITPHADLQPDGSLVYSSSGYGVEPCSRCGGQLAPGQDRGVFPAEWRPFHNDDSDCASGEACEYCEASHLGPHDGSCLL